MASTVLGFFDDRLQAEKAQADIAALGIPSSDIQIYSGSLDSKPSRSKKAKAEESFGEKVKRFFTGMSDYDNSGELDYYAEGMRRGGATVAVTADENQIDSVADILNRDGAADIDRRAEYWKESSGFSRYDYDAAPYSEDESLAYRQQYSDWEKNRFDDKKGDQVIPVIEEKVNVGKKAVEKGRVRIYTRVTETPVNEELQLREEKIDVDRERVDRPVNASDMSAFKEGEIELRETAEEAVVNKEARVVEEVRVHKDTQERTETINETARRTDVEVERDNDKSLRKDRENDLMGR